MEKRKNPTPHEIGPFEQDRRGKFSRIGILAMFAVAALCQAKLQIFKRDETIATANHMNRYVLSESVPAARGEILARDGQPLAKDDDICDLTIDFKKCPNTEAFWIDLSKASGIPATQLGQFAQEASLANSNTWIREWPKAVTHAQWTAISAVRSTWRADGVGQTSPGYRDYPLGEAASCMVGIIRKRFLPTKPGDKLYKTAVAQNGVQSDGNAQADQETGLERSLDPILRGQDGKLVGVTDRNGRFLPMRVESQIPKKNGQNVVLTIDRDLQSFAAAQLKQCVLANKAESGSVVIQDPSTGELLAIANYPSFQPYTPDGNYNALGGHGGLNQAYQLCLEPGSMFKILTLAKALDAGVVNMNSTFYCSGEQVVVPHSKPIKCDLHATGRAMGELDPVHAIARSCNIWAATWAVKVGYQPFTTYLKELGLFSKPNIGVPDTVKALINWRDPAKQLQLANLGFGQSINCSPVGLISAFSTLANNGVRIPPRLIKRIGDKDTEIPKTKAILSSTACDNVTKGMVAVMEDQHGTGKSLRIPGYCIAGKTGTAQKMGKGDPGHVSNFIGFVPAYHPKAVILVMINKPGGVHYYGAEVAGPVFRSIAEQVIRQYRLKPTEPIVHKDPIVSSKSMKSAPVDSDADDEADDVAPAPIHHRIKSKRIADDA